MSSWEDIIQAVQSRAGHRCEYCRMHEALQGATFHLEHIHPTSRGGISDLDNLAWACPGCNLHKSNRIEIADPDSHQTTRLFHPRTDSWADHFRWEGHHLFGLTVVGRGTVFALDLNHPRRLLIRQAEQLFGMFPPPEEHPSAA